MPAPLAVTALRRHLPASRLAPFLAEAGGDPDLSLALYQWNIQVGGAIQEVLGIVEVAVRHAIDEQLRVWNPTRGVEYHSKIRYTADWTTMPAAPLAGVLAEPLTQARRYAAKAAAKRNSNPHHLRCNQPITHDDIVSQLSFGVWCKMLPSDPKKQGLQQLWKHALGAAFPRVGPDAASANVTPEQLVYSRLDRLHNLRNRVAHMEPLLHSNIPARLTDAMAVLGYISPETRDWCGGMSRVTEVNNTRPARK
ncbi:hypothetical protein ACFO5K_10765 [Nocardia halotolerans]|uniref:Abi-like protein n=1 Tax=Nocardia halotolerans TaxID=1755878 RepID=A0ABV8VIC9_9NOCA